MATPRRPRKGVAYTDAELTALLAQLPDTPFRYRELVQVVTESGLAEGRGLVPMVANGIRTSLLTRGRLRAIPADGAVLLQKVAP
jgi:hypothetical protein